MFGVFRRKVEDPRTQIPYTLYESLQESLPRRRVRAVLEVILVAAAVLGLAFGTAALYKHLTEKKSNHGTTPTLTQMPQTNDKTQNKKSDSTSKKKQSSTSQKSSSGTSSSSVTQAPQVNENTAAPATKPTVTPESHTTNSGVVPKPN